VPISLGGSRLRPECDRAACTVCEDVRS
jgi:hypothetical protein